MAQILLKNKPSTPHPGVGQTWIATRIAQTTITAGQAVCLTSAGKVRPAYVDSAKADSEALQFRGFALADAAAGQPVPVLESGLLSGYDLSALNVGAKLYLGAAQGAVYDTPDANGTSPVGVVDAIPMTGGSPAKVIRVIVDWLTTRTFAGP